MATFKPFQAVRPKSEFSHLVASRPYDVLNSLEAKKEAEGNDISFLRVVKPEIDLPVGIDPYSDAVYQQGALKYSELKERKVLIQDSQPCFYIYRLTMKGRMQTGITGCCSFEEYYDGKIKKHELTRTVKENDRVNHVETMNANAEPVFFSYRNNPEISNLIELITQDKSEYDFVSDDDVRHELWIVKDLINISLIESLFREVPALYVADGHHRTAAAARVGKERKENNINHHGSEEYNYFLAVLFSDKELEILDYNRVVRDLNGHTPEEFLEALSENFLIEQVPDRYKPKKKGEFGLFVDAKWFRLQAISKISSESVVENLDVSYLSDHVLEPVLGITDLRKDERIDFVGGIRGLKELEMRVDSGEMAAAFSLFPVSMSELLSIADDGQIMPPKTTWFEPKLRSGLFIHELV